MAGRKPSNLFYRIETAKNEGPYRGSRITMSAFTAQHDLCNRPSPGNDQTLWRHWDRSDSQNYKFGFKTESQLRRWFTLAVLKRMQLEAGNEGEIFFVSVYRGECLAGKRQAIAKLNTLELVSRTPLAKYIEGEKLIKKGKMDIAPAPRGGQAYISPQPKIDSIFDSIFERLAPKADTPFVLKSRQAGLGRMLLTKY